MKPASSTRKTKHEKGRVQSAARPAHAARQPANAAPDSAVESTHQQRSSRFGQLGAWVLRERKELGITQRELATACKVSEDRVSAVENGSAIHRATFRLIVEGLDRLRARRRELLDSSQANELAPLVPFDAETLWVQLRAVTPSDRGGSVEGAATVQVAFQVWCELSTRKMALELDFDHDVVTEVYDSWYACLGVIRELMKALPVHQPAERESALAVFAICDGIINAALRPHLTRWQAEFRRWVTTNTRQPKFAKKRPQEIERDFPQFSALQKDLSAANERLVEYEVRLHEMVFGRGDDANAHEPRKRRP